MKKFKYDAAGGFAFLRSQLAYIEPVVYKVQYRNIIYRELIDVSTAAPEYSETIVYESMDQVGDAKFISSASMDVPLAEASMKESSHKVQFAATGYAYTDIELGQAMQLGKNLRTTKAEAARLAYEKKIQETLFWGDESLGVTGFLNNPKVGTYSLPANSKSSTKLTDYTPDELVDAFNKFVGDHVVETEEIEQFSTILLPTEHFNYIASKRLYTVVDASTGAYVSSGDTIKEFVENKSPYLQPGSIRSCPDLKNAGVNGTPRMVGYDNNKVKVQGHVPMPLKWLMPERRGLGFVIPAIFSCGGTEFRYPGSARYVDNI
ncbi:MAG: hypothetical protein OMM_00560 [Candidatus Magnetoglobus multicellularis str. Araruama]|uniref:Uncharacterized protein n=1 Tax=Candidatus Magnetoglobus multicellularis str. Araruama TaxID=890399 RepID=A0A1V1PGR9_9BACT|nr:MAG: hypothetical protein OMM_00560 [Candidatus Magnetoglobus multicellularis str. Araruama]